jgi:hypothetical protein
LKGKNLDAMIGAKPTGGRRTPDNSPVTDRPPHRNGN